MKLSLSKRHQLTIGLITMAALLTTGGAFAHGKKGQRMFGHLDQNGDGKVSQQEMRDAVLRLHDTVDANNDGAVTEKEATSFHENRRDERKKKGEAGKKGPPRESGKARGHGHAFFQKIDSDGDGKITKNEATAMADTKFQKMDRNGDGFVTKEEAKKARKSWKKKHGKHGDKQSSADGRSKRGGA